MSEVPIYHPTPPGRLEVKRLPAVRAYQAEGASDYFRERNQLFWRNFRFLQANRLPMTAPVEADVRQAAMRFYLPPDARVEHGVQGVDVVQLPARTVASVGVRGVYTRRRFQRGAEKLRAWLAGQGEWDAVGEPFAAYWDAPMKPWFLLRSEVQLEVRRRA